MRLASRLPLLTATRLPLPVTRRFPLPVRAGGSGAGRLLGGSLRATGRGSRGRITTLFSLVRPVTTIVIVVLLVIIVVAALIKIIQIF